LPAAVDAALNSALEQRMQSEIRPAMARLERQSSERMKIELTNYAKESDKRRQADLQAVEYAFKTYNRRLDFALASARSGGGD